MENPVAVTIFFGANDSSLKDENPKQHVPLDEYSANLRDMVQYLRSVDIPKERVILITPPPLCEAAWEKECILKGEEHTLACRAEGFQTREGPVHFQSSDSQGLL